MSLSAPRSQRPPSPANTTFSGISNYKSESFRTVGRAPSVPSIDTRRTARLHFEEIQAFLGDHAKEPLSSRASAREKLTRLTKQQFSELSTDVYDELMRRNNNKVGNEVPFLPLRQDFHPKRNQARQKLATLPIPRFRDLAGDVYFELCRRYPEFKEPEIIETPISASSVYEDATTPDFRERSPPPTTQSPVYSPISPILNSSRRNLSREQNSPFQDRRRPSEDTLRSPDRMTPGRRPSGDDAGSVYGGGSVSGSIATATSGVIIPNKSTIAEEEITVPFERRDERASRSTVTGDDKDDPYDDRDTEDGASVGFKSPSSPPAGLAGLNALSNVGNNRPKDRLRDSDDEPGNARSGESDYYDRSYRSPTSPSRSQSVRTRQSNQSNPDGEKLRREYELKIATMQSRINNLEGEVTETNARKAESDDLVKQLQNELEQFRSRAEDQSVAMLALRRELDDLRAAQARDRDRRRPEDEEEIHRLRVRCEELESERESLKGAGSEHTMLLIEQLRSDLETFASETRELSRQNEELMAARDSDNMIIRDLNMQAKQYKQKYEQAKTELRSVKATSQLYHQAPKVLSDDQLPVGPSGGLLDIHVTAFLSAIDLLLAAGRSSTPTRVLSPMKSVINAVHAIIDDVEKYEARARRERLDIELEDLQALRERAEMTLSNLTTAAKTHATSLGMSPVSLLDAAASHVASTITEIGKAVHIRKATKAEQDTFGVPGSPTMSNYAAQLRTVDEGNYNHIRTQSSASSRADEYGSPPRNGRYRELSPPRAPRTPVARRPPSEPSSSMTSSPPALFDNAPPSDGSAPTEQGDDAWLELKPYLEAQSESIKYAIQSVLSAVRSPAPAPHLNENLTQIITIVSSIVAVCKDSLPSTSMKEGNDILRELSDHCNKLSEIQAQSEVTKESRQAMAKSSFAIANAMKSLVKM